jgi:hypothetical protein
MAEHLAPGIHIEETGYGPPRITGASTAASALLGTTGRGPRALQLVTSHADYERLYGPSGRFLPDTVRGFG